ncbi:photosystem I assembly protein Ycf3 [Polystyrenella longa]|uniref:Photosystem I assembly protein Ycf3 n=1 Tax=Polystyrenella longa TaxID=2528007 RepID=A0A518CJT0_9PLAN|nr:tetratricopeptide repeat protein [Polystyrenella longa]QDU79467.1 photosystem I assembly protein Ycf3 [Polystyrenella longa]
MNQQSASSFDFSRLLYPLLIVIGVIAVYQQTASFDFVNYDDELYVAGNYRVQQGLNLETAQWAFTTTEIGNWHPLTWLSLLMDVSLFGPGAGAMHSMNMFYHLFNALLLYGLLRYATGAPFRSFLVAFLFAVHPLHAESVAWISGRKDLISTLFGFLAIWAYFVYVKQIGVSKQLSRQWYGIMIACFGLSLLAKQMFVTLPFLLLLLDVWPLKRFSLKKLVLSTKAESQLAPEAAPDTSTQNDTIHFSQLIVEKIPLFGLSILFSIIIYAAQQAGGAVQSGDRFPLALRLQNAILSYGLYLKKTFLPNDLAVIYPHPGTDINHTSVLIALAVLAVVTLIVLLRIRKQPALAVGWFWFLGMLVPVIGLVQLGDERMADRYSYVPQVGLTILFCWLAPPTLLKKKPVALVSAGVALLFCLAMSQKGYQQVATWKDSETLMEQALTVTENNWKANHNLARYWHHHEGSHVEISAKLNESLRIKPDNVAAMTLLANVVRDEGETEFAKSLFEKAEELEPKNQTTLVNFGNFYQSQNQFDKAIEYYQRAIEVKPEEGLPYANLVIALDIKGDRKAAYEAGLQALERKTTLDPYNLANVYMTLGILNMKAGKPDAGIDFLQRAVEVAPDHPQANANLKRALQMRGQMPR